MRAGRRVHVFFSLHALVLAACAERTAREAPSTPAGPRPWRELPEYRMLADAGTFEASAVGDGGDTPLSAVAFTRLVLRDDARAVFEDLLHEENLVARLYGLKGLWLADRARYRLAAEELARVDRKVPALIGCTGDDVPLRSLVGEAWSDWTSPVALFNAGIGWLEGADPRTMDAGGWRSILLDPDQPEDHRLGAARVLASSLGGPGLDVFLGSLPSLDAEIRPLVLEVLSRIPPWNAGTFESVKKALEGDDRIVQEGAVRAVISLARHDPTRAACHGLVPRMQELLAAFAAREAAVEESEEEMWLCYMYVALRSIGGPAGPVLARALGHRAGLVREVAIEFSTLGEWADETIAELVELLGHPEANVRGGAAAMLCLALDAGDPDFEEVRRAVERRLPAIRSAIAALADPERGEIEEDLARAFEGSR
jgi:hypothetical protein